MKTSKLFSSSTILICTACVILSFLGQVLKITPIVNVAYICSLLLIFTSYFLRGYSTILMFFLMAMVGVSMVLRGINLSSVDYYSHALIMICTFICLEVGAFVKITVKAFKIISISFLAMTILLLILYYIGPLKNSYFEGTDAICLNIFNPNAAGLWLVCIFSLLFYCGLVYKGRLKYLFLFVAVATTPIILATDSRNSFFACIFLVVGAIVSKLFKIKKLPRWMLVVLSCLPLIVFAFYMFVIVENFEFWEELFSLDQIDKGIDTRQGIWGRVIDNFWDNFLIGNYPRYFNSQQHNSLLTVYCRFGVFATVATCFLIYLALKHLQENSSFYATLSLSAILFTGCFEASVFTGVAGLYLMLLIIPACASIEKI